MMTATTPASVATCDPFVARCLASGFRPCPERWRDAPSPLDRVAVNWVRWVDGTLWLAIPGAEVLTAKGHCQLPATRKLSDFAPPARNLTLFNLDPPRPDPCGLVQRSLFDD